jgi:hypothetical protein
VHRWLAGVLFLFAGVSAAPAHELLDRLDACVGRLDQDLDVGYERVAARCPELTASLAHSAWSPWLPADWNQPRNQLSAAGLTELRKLLARSLEPTAPVRAPSTQKLAAVMARISQADDSRQGWWERFKAWLRRLTTGHEGESDPLRGWLSALDLSRGAAQVLAWLTLALVMAIALVIVLNELRIAGVLKVRAPEMRGGLPRRRADPADRTLVELEQRDLREQPALLLQLIADRLTEQGCLPPARALTTRELLRGARLANESEHHALTELARACEQLRFSTRDFAGASLASAIAAGQRVLAGLAAAGPARQAATPRA